MKSKYVILSEFVLFFLVSATCIGSELESYSYSLSQSDSAYTIWTTPPSERVFKNSPIPSDTGSMVKLYAAKNEFEPFQVIIHPNSDETISISIDDFGHQIQTEIYQVDYISIQKPTDNLGITGDYPDPLWPVENYSSVYLPSNQNTSFWFSVFVPKETVSGEYQTTIHIGSKTIPVVLHVFNFAIPDELNVKSQMNFSHNALLEKYTVQGTNDEYWFYVFKMKQFFIDHRLTPKAPLWSGGLTSSGAPYIDYDCNGTFKDNDEIWGFEIPADVFLNGNGFNDGTGFPSFMAATFVNNDASQDQRPSTFCGETRTSTDWVGGNFNSPYNQKWFAYIKAIQDYLDRLGYLEKAYYYIANEPQNQEDYDAVAWYAQELKKAAPNYKLMVSEEPKPELYNHPQYSGAKIDIWLSVLNQYDPVISQDRKKNYGESTWIYFLHGTRPPFFNPITLDHPGIESKLTGWFLWKYRIEGIAYYSLNNWSKNPWTDPATDNHNGDMFMLYPPSKTNAPIPYGSNNHRFVPSIRFELMRDSLEDYEYLYVLNGNQQPVIESVNQADQQSDKIILGLTSYNRNSEFMYNLRRVIGLKNGNEISVIPDLNPPATHPRAEGTPSNYYINFQDPEGEPLDDPLIVDGKEYLKIGWQDYDKNLGYGWYGDMAHVMYKYLSDGPNPLQKSIIYDDWGRQHTFEFDLPNGTYNVTISAGWQGRTYAHNQVEIEGIDFINDEATAPYIVRTKEI
ncbi:MAG: DUF4091 domain-containing protein, partial [Desulfobacterales bacterium]|nr:DUF4091 domain-containing protein [Desulfobacterales bacterium]